jgi:hypothetical protein
MGTLVLNGATSGSTTIAPTDAVTVTLTLPSASGSQTLGIQGPAFSAYQSSGQTLSSNTNTKIQIQTKEFDTNSNYDATTNYRFTPTIAGYYQISGAFQITSTFCGGVVNIYKNGAAFKQGSAQNTGSVANAWAVSALIYLNGSTDYVELYGSVTVGQNTLNTQNGTYFQGVLVRGA